MGQLCNRVGSIAALYVRTARRLIHYFNILAPFYYKIVMRDMCLRISERVWALFSLQRQWLSELTIKLLNFSLFCVVMSYFTGHCSFTVAFAFVRVWKKENWIYFGCSEFFVCCFDASQIGCAKRRAGKNDNVILQRLTKTNRLRCVKIPVVLFTSSRRTVCSCC